MNVKELTVDQVKIEIAQIIRDNPTCCGVAHEDGDDGECVYYTDRDGFPVASLEEEPEDQELVTPICLIGRWVEDFHPDLKQDSEFRNILLRNRGLYSVSNEEVPFNDKVLEFLKHVQIQQDDRVTWDKVKLDNFTS